MNTRPDPLAALKAMPQWGPKWMRFAVAYPVGCLVMLTGLDLLDVRLEWFHSIATFSLSWVFCMTVLPIVTGMVVGAIYGYGGKYLAHFPPVAVIGFFYYESMTHTLPPGFDLIPWQLCGFILILQMEFCAFGGVLGELLIRPYIGWDSPVEPQWADSEPLPTDADSEPEPISHRYSQHPSAPTSSK
ncbi:MAG: hypothetical protein Q9M26_01665 [Mariprofundales bacterium]|nr:hypothetical protein [Mariprofundales bacterium]